MLYQRDYYICNPYTKQFVHIPPSSRCLKEVRVGFICDPYYKEEVDLKQESNIQVDSDFRFAIVRIVPQLSDQYCSAFKFDAEIFSSEMGRWTQSVVDSPRDICLDSLDRSGGIAYNGMLYWWSAHDGFIIGLDPYYYSSNKHHDYYPAYFHSIDVPFIPNGYRFSHLSVSQGGRLRFCHFKNGVPVPSVCVWELKDDKGGQEWCCLTGYISLRPMVHQSLPYYEWGRHLVDSVVVLAFDPSNDDIFYLQFFDRVVACNIHEKKFKKTRLSIPCNSVVRFGRAVFPFVLPRWQTPLPRLK
ncbi:PREDICTED: uncharacterized protein LOC101312372 [Fragaria vesca subsp. vesca]|uniref:uncharacterized protein LOC101312372 n=1 Tax=Fragaria vesca subsp. vesca TaxID=101020 RepID=UPI0002C34004|nr:PREDICTED: uncharacterized protein LOC101312372 [Fragaria vesca subsp. vesca]